MVQVSFTLPIPHDKRAEGAAAQLARKMGIDPALVVHAKPMGPDFTFFVVYGRVNHLVELDKVEVFERDYPLLTPKEVNAPDQEAPATTAGGGGGVHRVRCAHRRHRCDPQHQGLRRREGPGVLLEPRGAQPRRAGVGPGAGGHGRDGQGRRRPRLAGRHPARRAPAQHQGDDGGLPGGVPPGAPAGDRRRRPALRRVDGRRARGRPHLRQGHDTGRGRLVPGAPTGQGRDDHDVAGGGPGRSGGGVPGGAPSLRALLARPLRRQPRGRRLRASPSSGTWPPS